MTNRQASEAESLYVGPIDALGRCPVLWPMGILPLCPGEHTEDLDPDGGRGGQVARGGLEEGD